MGEYAENFRKLCFKIEYYILDHKEDFIYDKFDLFDARDILTDNASFYEIFEELGYDTSYLHPIDFDAICRKVCKIVCDINKERESDPIEELLGETINSILNNADFSNQELGMYFIKKGVTYLKNI